MKIWKVMYNGECEYASTHYADALNRANFLKKWYSGTVEIVEDVVKFN